MHTSFRLALLGVLLLFNTLSAQAQEVEHPIEKDYNFSAGLRTNLLDIGLSAKGFITNHLSLEGFVGTPVSFAEPDIWFSAVVASAYGEWNFSAADAPYVNWIVGAGWYLEVPTFIGSSARRLYTGPSAIFGVECIFPKAPLAFQFDLTPSYFLSQQDGGLNLDLSLAMRYIF